MHASVFALGFYQIGIVIGRDRLGTQNHRFQGCRDLNRLMRLNGFALALLITSHVHTLQINKCMYTESQAAPGQLGAGPPATLPKAGGTRFPWAASPVC